MSANKPKATSSKTGASFSYQNRLIRLCWNVVWIALASWTPPQFHCWRRLLLRLFGAKMGRRSDVRGGARVWLPSNLGMEEESIMGPGVICYNMAAVQVGAHSVISQRVSICAGTHDFEALGFPLLAKPITIGNHVWVGAEAFVGPGAIISDGAILGARSVAFGHLEPWTIYVGNPAKVLRARKKVNETGAR